MSTVSARVEFSIWELMYAGSNLATLRNASARTLIAQTRRRSPTIPDRLRLLEADLESLELSQSEAVLLKNVRDLLERLESPDRSLKHLGSDAVALRTLAARVEQALQVEASARSAFVVQRSREGEIQDLLQDPAAFFGIIEGGPLELTPRGRMDFYEAGRCYAVGFAAASIMFMLRGTEEVLRCYYQQVTQQPAKGAWGNFVTVLEIPVLKCPAELIDRLKKLGQRRNEAMHPKERLPSEWDAEAAKQLLMNCQQAVTMIVKDLERRSSAMALNQAPI